MLSTITTMGIPDGAACGTCGSCMPGYHAWFVASRLTNTDSLHEVEYLVEEAHLKLLRRSSRRNMEANCQLPSFAC